MLKVETELEDGPGVENAIGTDAPPPAPQPSCVNNKLMQHIRNVCALNSIRTSFQLATFMER